MSAIDINSILTKLGLAAVNPGAWSGSKGWSTTQEGTLINVRNPGEWHGHRPGAARERSGLRERHCQRH